jgi:hypothetical protein
MVDLGACVRTMWVMRVILVAALLIGCSSSGRSLEAQLDGMTTVTLRHADGAMRIVEGAFAMPSESAQVRWVVGQMPETPEGATINGAAIECDIWVSWFGDQWRSGASDEGPAISSSAFAHEMAHCALWMQGDADSRHSRSDWWGPNGRVAGADAALVAAGL